MGHQMRGVFNTDYLSKLLIESVSNIDHIEKSEKDRTSTSDF